MSEERVACGSHHPNPAMEKRLAAANALIASDSPEGCCGAAGVWHLMFRCADCCRWFHRECLRRHFAAHGENMTQCHTLAAAKREAISKAVAECERAREGDGDLRQLKARIQALAEEGTP